MVMEPLAVFTALSTQPVASPSKKPLLAITPSHQWWQSNQITNGGKQIHEGIYGGWETLAAAEIDGVNTVLWKNKAAANRLHILGYLDSNWNLSVARTGSIPIPQLLTFETNFNLDLNGDSVIGQALRIKESEGSVDLLTGTNDLAFAKDKSGDTHDITWNGQQIGEKTWLDFSIVAAENINEQNQFAMAQSAISGDLRIFSADSKWAGQSNTNWT